MPPKKKRVTSNQITVPTKPMAKRGRKKKTVDSSHIPPPIKKKGKVGRPRKYPLPDDNNEPLTGVIQTVSESDEFDLTDPSETPQTESLVSDASQSDPLVNDVQTVPAPLANEVEMSPVETEDSHTNSVESKDVQTDLQVPENVQITTEDTQCDQILQSDKPDREIPESTENTNEIPQSDQVGVIPESELIVAEIINQIEEITMKTANSEETDITKVLDSNDHAIETEKTDMELEEIKNMESKTCEVIEQLENLEMTVKEKDENPTTEVQNYDEMVEETVFYGEEIAEANEIVIQEEHETNSVDSDLTISLIEQKNNAETKKIIDDNAKAELVGILEDEEVKKEIEFEMKPEKREEKPTIEEKSKRKQKPPKPKKKIKIKSPKKHLDKLKIEDENSVRRSNRIKSISTQNKRSKGLVKLPKPIKLPEITTDSNENSNNSISNNDSEKSSSTTASPVITPISNDYDNKPVKVKSRWRRSSELEMNVLTPAAQVMESQLAKLAELNSKITNNDEQNKLEKDEEVQMRLKQFVHLKDNLYLTDRMSCKEAKKMICDCFLSHEEIDRGEFGCGEDCLNRLLMIECGNFCPIGDRCTNKKFQKGEFAPVEVFKTDKKGLGLRATANIPYGEFILEYVGEVLDHEEFDIRADDYSKDKNTHYYFMSLRADAIIDATRKGNISRFINHSCEPNAETQKWTVNGELRIGFFSTRTILAGEEITFDYRFQRYGKEAQKCFCETPTCRGWLGEEPDDEDDDEDEEEEEDEEVEESKNEEQTIEVKEKKKIEKKIVKKERKKRLPRKPRKDIFEDLDQLDEEIEMLVTTGLKNQAHTLKLSRLMVRAKEPIQRAKLMRILRRGELPCRRLFLDYHGLRLMHGYMTDAQQLAKTDKKYESLRLELLQTLATLPIPNKTMLQDSKVLPTVEKWSDKEELPVDSDSCSPQIDQDLNETPSQNQETEKLIIKEETLSEVKSDKEEIKSDTEEVKVSEQLTESMETETINIEPEPELEKVIELKVEKITETEKDPEDTTKVMENKEKESVADVTAETNAKVAVTDDSKESIEEKLQNPEEKTDEPIMEVIDIKSETNGIVASEENVDNKLKLNVEPEPNYEEEIIALALKLLEEWSNLKEVFKIPKKERIEQMKEHEREANRGYIAGLGLEQDAEKKSEMRYRVLKRFRTIDKTETNRNNNSNNNNKCMKMDERTIINFPKLGKYERRKMFALQVEQREEERRRKQRELWRQHEQHCILFGTDPRLTAPFDPNRGYQCIWNPQIGQWQNYPLPPTQNFPPPPNSHPINLPPPPNPYIVQPQLPTLPYQEEIKQDEDLSHVKFMGPIPPPVKLPPKWKCAKDKYGRPYYYHIKIRKSQWEPPPYSQPQEEIEDSSSTTSSSDTSSLSSDTSSDDSDSDEDLDDSKLLQDVKKQMEKQIKQTLNKSMQQNKTEENDTPPSSIDEEIIEKNNENDKIDNSEQENEENMDEINCQPPPTKKQRRTGLVQEIIISPRTEEDRLQFRADLKRYKQNKEKLKKQKEMILLHSKKHTKEKKHKTSVKAKMKEMADCNSEHAKKIKETFRSNMATVVVSVLNAYRKPDCKEGRITNTEDFKHLARKLTHFVMLKEMKHIEKIEDLVCTENVKSKAKEYIRKYMSKFGENYQKRNDEPDF